MDEKDARKKYEGHRRRTKRRTDRHGDQIEFRLTFEEWCDIWLQSGKWELRGKGHGKYVMSRNDDIGHYEVGNVFIQLATQNTSDAAVRTNAASTPELRARISASVKATMADPELRARISASVKATYADPELRAKLSKAISKAQRPKHSEEVKSLYRKVLEIGPTKGSTGKISIQQTARDHGVSPGLAKSYYEGKFLEDLD